MAISGELDCHPFPDGISRSRPVLVVSCDELNDAEQPIVVDVTSFSPQGAAALLTVRVGDELGGYARCRTISFARCGEHAHEVGPDADHCVLAVELHGQAGAAAAEDLALLV